MANKTGKEVDTTYLSLTQAAGRGFIHRDYLAHCLRWSHVCKHLQHGLQYRTAHVLDVGCGRETPLPKMMFSMRMTHTTGSYTGVDYGPIPHPDTISEATSKFQLTLLPKTDFVKAKLPREHYDIVTCFEMLEHVEPWHSYQTLKRIRQVLQPLSGVAFISTPCYDPQAGAAANHVNEMSYAGLELLISSAGLAVQKVYGTFASQKDYKKLLTPAQRELFDQLGEYYDSNWLSCLFAPLVPQQSRNCLWVLTPGDAGVAPPAALAKFQDPSHSNSARWAEDLTKIMADAKKTRR